MKNRDDQFKGLSPSSTLKDWFSPSQNCAEDSITSPHFCAYQAIDGTETWSTSSSHFDWPKHQLSQKHRCSDRNSLISLAPRTRWQTGRVGLEWGRKCCWRWHPCARHGVTATQNKPRSRGKEEVSCSFFFSRDSLQGWMWQQMCLLPQEVLSALAPLPLEEADGGKLAWCIWCCSCCCCCHRLHNHHHHHPWLLWRNRPLEQGDVHYQDTQYTYSPSIPRPLLNTLWNFM